MNPSRDASLLQIDPYVVNTHAFWWRRARAQGLGPLGIYPIPDLPVPEGQGRKFLDVGCSWGRWSISAARLGYDVYGVDSSLEAIEAARRIARQLGLSIDYRLASAGELPFSSLEFDQVFSYNVFPYLKRSDSLRGIAEAWRVLKPGGRMKLQMANRWGIRNLAHVAAKAVSEHGILDGGEQYWSPGDLLKEASALMDGPTLKAWGFFCLDSEPCDLPYIGWKNRAVLGISQFLRNRALKSGWMHWFADSLSLEALRDSRGTRP